jgi:lysophospholipase L1-like esterase
VDNYTPPEIQAAEAYTILFVGDSMMATLGPELDSLRILLSVSYPNKVFGLFNYGVSASNILDLPRRLTETTDTGVRQHPPILERNFDIIIIESFGHNPLSELDLETGIKRQTAVLDEVVAQLVYHRPGSLIVFMTPIGLSHQFYALQTRDLSPEVRSSWVDERIAYIENHRRYAQEHNIPLIDVYAKSLDSSGEVNLAYVDSGDYIHPSLAGVELMSQQIAAFLEGVLPH